MGFILLTAQRSSCFALSLEKWLKILIANKSATYIIDFYSVVGHVMLDIPGLNINGHNVCCHSFSRGFQINR